jgi:hypothetical protein
MLNGFDERLKGLEADFISFAKVIQNFELELALRRTTLADQKAIKIETIELITLWERSRKAR